MLGPLSVAGAVGLVLVAAAAVVSGSSGAAGAMIGTLMICAVFAFGAVVLGIVATVSPSASLYVALLTYLLQVVAVGLVYAALKRGGQLDGQVDARWLSAAVIACTLAWTAAMVVGFTRARRPIYDLPSHGTEANVR